MSTPLSKDAGLGQIPHPIYAVVYVPGRSRSRFAASCVEVFDSSTQALDHANPADKRFAAKLNGPSKSSEGQSIYYLLHWLDSEPQGASRK